VAKIVTVRLADDLDKDLDANVTREIGIDGFIYVLDLSDKHSEALDADLARWLEAAHQRVKWPKKQLREALKEADPDPTPVLPGKPQERVDKDLRRKIRDWGRRNGFEVSDRGYLPKRLVEAFHEAHKGRK
jgi:hypothetical protein